MRPHLLELTAFGPFPGTVSVDFDALASAGLFLLHGDTGAGKSSLLDALGFALYGRLPGQRGTAKRLRSDHADGGTRTSVQLVVTLAGRRLRITRSPEQQRAKRRGSGTTREQSGVLLEEWVGTQWSTRSTRLDETALELERLIGMTAEQFFQVVLLPQGEFATFLRADSAQRGEVLRRLFATDRFSQVEDWLAGRRLASARRAEQLGQDRDVLLARVVQAVGAEPTAMPEPAVAAAWVRTCRDAAAGAARSAGLFVAEAESRRNTAR
ncbi:MAG: SMC family ATPase, partial [Actinomycetota bacterium]|nr:SMC family ATPase [Actinomycetota bacterium]